MTRTDIANAVLKTLKTYAFEGQVISEDTVFGEIEIDSLDHILAITDIEDKLGLEIPECEEEQFHNSPLKAFINKLCDIKGVEVPAVLDFSWANEAPCRPYTVGEPHDDEYTASERLEIIKRILDEAHEPDWPGFNYDLQAVNQVHRIAAGGPLPKETKQHETEF